MTGQADEPPPSRRYCHWCKWITLIIVATVMALLLAGGAIFCKLKAQKILQNCEASSLEILQGDTILVYNSTNTSHNIQIAGEFENESDGEKLNVILFPVDCNDLAEHKNYINVQDLSLNLDGGPPTFIPPGYNHYELGSKFSYLVTLKSVPNSSSLTFLVFDNTVDASYYESHSTDPDARSKAMFVHHIAANSSSHIPFEPNNTARYFITMFDPKTTGGGFKLIVSYSVVQTYYQNNDYLPYEKQCRLNSTDMPCYFDLSNNTCVLAYNPSSSSTDTNAVRLTTSTVNDTTKILVHHIVFFFLLAVLIGHITFTVCGVVVFIVCRTFFKKQQLYTQLKDHA